MARDPITGKILAGRNTHSKVDPTLPSTLTTDAIPARASGVLGGRERELEEGYFHRAPAGQNIVPEKPLSPVEEIMRKAQENVERDRFAKELKHRRAQGGGGPGQHGL